jgi:hypothetical protein
MGLDYPAAHSMDTIWYAVDRDGHIAVFDSGEDGAVPQVAAPDEEEEETTLDRFAGLVPWSLAEFQRALGSPDGAEPHPAFEGKLPEKPRNKDDWQSPWTLMFLESAEPLRQEIARKSAREMPATEGVAVLVKNLSRPLADRLHQAGACLGCFGPYKYHELPALLGLFSYDHTDRHVFEYSTCAPYERVRLPIRLLRADQLPPDVREQVEGMRFASLCFAEAELIQPIDHADCESWGSAYLDLDGKILRAVPGREAEFRREFHASNVGPDYRIEPPDGGPGPLAFRRDP